MRGHLPGRAAGLVTLILAAGCTSGQPVKIEPENGSFLACTTEKTYPDFSPPGCTCKDTWSYNGKKYCGTTCANPDDDPNGPWCFTAATCNGQNWSYCERKSPPDLCDETTLAWGYGPPTGCTCRTIWSAGGKTICNAFCANPDNDPGGPWCYTNGVCNGQDRSYCQPATQPETCDQTTIAWGYRPAQGCTCKTTWSYAGKTICNASCANPDSDPAGPWCYTAGTCNGNTWSFCSAP